MTNESDKTPDLPAAAGDRQPGESAPSSRRHVLKLGAAAVPAIATLSPSMAMAQSGGAAVSLMACTVSMPQFVSANGHPVEARDVLRSTGNGQGSDKNNKGFKSPTGMYHLDVNNQPVVVYQGPPQGSYSGQQIKDSMESGNLVPPMGVEYEQYQAHVTYLNRVRNREIPGAGLTCLVSISGNMNTFST